MRSKIIPVVALFITFVTSYLLFAGLNGKLPTHLLLSFLSTNEEKIERALVSSDGLLYYRADGTAGKKAFEFIETEIIKVLEREAPEQAKQYNALKNAKNQTLDYENYGKLGLSYGAVYFNKTHFIDILGVLTGEFEPAETLELLKNDFKKIPNIQIETVGDYSFKVTSAPNPQYMQNFPITLIVEVQKDKIIVATEEVFPKFLERLKNPEDTSTANIFNSEPNDFLNMVLDFKNTMNYFGVFLSMYGLGNPEVTDELNALHKVSFNFSFTEAPTTSVGTTFTVHTDNPSSYEKHFDDFFANSDKYTRTEHDKELLNDLKNNLTSNKSDAFFSVSYKWDAEKIASMTKNMLEKQKRRLEQQRILLEEHKAYEDSLRKEEEKRLEEQKMLEENMLSDKDKISPIEPQIKNESPK